MSALFHGGAVRTDALRRQYLRTASYKTLAPRASPLHLPGNALVHRDRKVPMQKKNQDAINMWRFETLAVDSCDGKKRVPVYRLWQDEIIK